MFSKFSPETKKIGTLLLLFEVLFKTTGHCHMYAPHQLTRRLKYTKLGSSEFSPTLRAFIKYILFQQFTKKILSFKH